MMHGVVAGCFGRQSIALSPGHQRNIELDFEKKGCCHAKLSLLVFLEVFTERGLLCLLLMYVICLRLAVRRLF